MKRLAALIALAAPMSAAAHEPPIGHVISFKGTKAESLLSLCSETSDDESYCSAYIMGVHDALSTHGELCPSDGVTRTQIVAVVMTRLRAAPATWHYPGYFSVAEALIEAFACDPKKRVTAK